MILMKAAHWVLQHRAHQEHLLHQARRLARVGGGGLLGATQGLGGRGAGIDGDRRRILRGRGHHRQQRKQRDGESAGHGMERYIARVPATSAISRILATIALALLVSLAYFYAGLSRKGFRYFEYYVEPTPIMLPFKIVEDFTKPLSLSFRLFGNILADELVVAVLAFLVPLVVPLPAMFLGLFTSAIQALIFATLAAYYIGEAVHEEHH